MNALEITKLHQLINKTQGNPKINIGLIDGPINFKHTGFDKALIKSVRNFQNINCINEDSSACIHGTFVAGILCSKLEKAPGICPNCTLLIRPIFNDSTLTYDMNLPMANPNELANAIKEVIDDGARIINLSLGTSTSSIEKYQIIYDAYDYALKNGVIIVISAGNQGTMGTVSLINHPWVIPVTVCDERGSFTAESNFGLSIGRKGLMAPGKNIISILARGGLSTMSGSSFASPFVSGTIALLWSLFPDAKAVDIVNAVIPIKRNSIIPQLLDAEKAYKILGQKFLTANM